MDKYLRISCPVCGFFVAEIQGVTGVDPDKLKVTIRHNCSRGMMDGKVEYIDHTERLQYLKPKSKK